MTSSRRSATGKRLSQYLLTHRKRMGLSQAEVGSLLGLGDGTMVSRYERGTRLPPFLMTLRLCIIYRATPRELFTGRYDQLERETARRAQRLLKQLGPVPRKLGLTHKLAYLSALAQPRRGRLDNLPIHDEDSGH